MSLGDVALECGVYTARAFVCADGDLAGCAGQETWRARPANSVERHALGRDGVDIWPVVVIDADVELKWLPTQIELKQESVGRSGPTAGEGPGRCDGGWHLTTHDEMNGNA